MTNTDAGEAQTITPIMCHLDKEYNQKNIKSGTPRIVDETHPKKQTSTKDNTMNTNHTLTNNSNP